MSEFSVSERYVLRSAVETAFRPSVTRRAVWKRSTFCRIYLHSLTGRARIFANVFRRGCYVEWGIKIVLRIWLSSC